MINIKIKFSYIGKNYNGWDNKKNKNNTSIKYHFEKILKKFSEKKFFLKISSRTDKAVNASNQIISCLCEIKKKTKIIKKILKNNLPRDIIIKKIKKEKKEFDAKKNNFCKLYTYSLINSRNNMNKNFSIKKKINVNYFNEISKYLLGENNFKNLKSKKCSSLISLRKIIEIKIKKNKKKIKFNILGNAFCYKMIRIIISFLIKKSAQNNSKNVKSTAAAENLCLKKIFFIKNLKNPFKIEKLKTPKFPLNNIIF